MTTDGFIWWEKTVEYAFVLQADRKKKFKDFAPLSGVQERAGDAIFNSSGVKLVLIEFKRSFTELDSEKQKFAEGDYEKAKICLGCYDLHHFLIYGEVLHRSLSTRACTYFSRVEVDQSLTVFDRGVCPEFFCRYLEIFLEKKKPDARSNGSLGIDGMTNVIGISGDGLECAIFPLSEYLNRYFEGHKYQPQEGEEDSDSESLGQKMK